MYLTVQQWKWNNLNPIELGWHVKENTMVPVKQINQWLRRAFLNFCLVVAKLVVAKHVDAGNSYYITLLCGVHSFIHSFILAISIAPLQVFYYSDALPTTARILYRSFTPKRTGNCR